MNCSELRTKLAEIKTLKEELVSGLAQAQNHEDTLILVNLQEKIEKRLESLGEILPINIDKLEEKHGEGESLSKRELWFIYELDKLFNKKTRVRGENIEERRQQTSSSWLDIAGLVFPKLISLISGVLRVLKILNFRNKLAVGLIL